MDEYLAWFLNITHWHWLALAIALAGFEMLSMSFFLIFPALSAALLGLIVYVEPGLDWRIQVLIFAALSVVTTMLGRAWLRKVRGVDGPQVVNVRGQTYVGRRLRTTDALENGRGRVHMDDTWWTARSVDGAPIDAGMLIEVVEVDGATLLVKTVGES
jgi:membrane protein implicated in regulation of membrane protease activity